MTICHWLKDDEDTRKKIMDSFKSEEVIFDHSFIL